VQRCIRHKERNVPDHLPERDRPPVKARLRRPRAEDDHQSPSSRPLAKKLERSHPGAAVSLRQGMHETLTVARRRIKGGLR